MSRYRIRHTVSLHNQFIAAFISPIYITWPLWLYFFRFTGLSLRHLKTCTWKQEIVLFNSIWIKFLRENCEPHKYSFTWILLSYSGIFQKLRKKSPPSISYLSFYKFTISPTCYNRCLPTHVNYFDRQRSHIFRSRTLGKDKRSNFITKHYNTGKKNRRPICTSITDLFLSVSSFP